MPKTPDEIIIAEIAALAADTRIPESQRKRWQGALEVFQEYQFNEDGTERTIEERIMQYTMDAQMHPEYGITHEVQQFNMIGMSAAKKALDNLPEYPSSLRAMLQAELIAITAPILADNDRMVAIHDSDRKKNGKAVVLKDDAGFIAGMPKFLENAQKMRQTILDDLPASDSALLLERMDTNLAALAAADTDLETKKNAAIALIRIGDSYKYIAEQENAHIYATKAGPSQSQVRAGFVARQQDVLQDAATYLDNSALLGASDKATKTAKAAGERAAAVASLDSLADLSVRGDQGSIQRVFSEAIQRYSAAADLENGIERHYSRPHPDGSVTLIRDARALDASSGTDHLRDDFARQFLNAARTSMKLCELHGKPMDGDTTAQFAKLLQDQLTHLDKAEDPKKAIQECNAALLAFHCKQTGMNPKEAEKEFKQARDYMNFQDQHFDIVTISANKDGRTGAPKVVVEADVMVKELTPQQRSEYEAIARIPERMELIRKRADAALAGEPLPEVLDMPPLPKWYRALPVLEQRLLQEVAGDVAAGTKSIPTQLLDIAGTRNAWVKQVAVADAPAAGTPVALRVVNETAHCGALYSTSKNQEQAQHIANENARQLKAALGGRPHVNTLNSPTFFRIPNPFSHEERDIVPQTRKALEGVGGAHSGTPFNFIRNVSRADHDGFKQQLTEIAGTLDGVAGLEHVKAYLEGKNVEGEKRGFFGRMADKVTGREVTFEMAQAQIQAAAASNPGDPALKILREAISLRRDIKAGNPIFRDGENHSLTKATTSALLANDVNDVIRGTKTSTLVPGLAQLEPLASVVSCKSGKDRTGVAMFNVAAVSVAHALGQNADQLMETRRVMANTGHEQHRAGEQGATLGNRGIQSTTRDAVPDSWGLRDVLNRATANFNKGLKYSVGKFKSLFGGAKKQAEVAAAPAAERGDRDRGPEQPLLDVEMSSRNAHAASKEPIVKWFDEVVQPHQREAQPPLEEVEAHQPITAQLQAEARMVVEDGLLDSKPLKLTAGNLAMHNETMRQKVEAQRKASAGAEVRER